MLLPPRWPLSECDVIGVVARHTEADTWSAQAFPRCNIVCSAGGSDHGRSADAALHVHVPNHGREALCYLAVLRLLLCMRPLRARVVFSQVHPHLERGHTILADLNASMHGSGNVTHFSTAALYPLHINHRAIPAAADLRVLFPAHPDPVALWRRLSRSHRFQPGAGFILSPGALNAVTPAMEGVFARAASKMLSSEPSSTRGYTSLGCFSPTRTCLPRTLERLWGWFFASMDEFALLSEGSGADAAVLLLQLFHPFGSCTPPRSRRPRPERHAGSPQGGGDAFHAVMPAVA
jgi:hypothetical protein